MGLGFRSRGAVLWLAAAACAVAGGPAAGAQDADPAEQWRAARAAVAKELVQLGSWCAGRGLKNIALERFREALTYDRDEETARARLGHRKGPDGWVAPGKPPQVTEDMLSPMGVDPLEAETARAGTVCAGALAAVARWCDERRLDAEAEKAWWTAISFDPRNDEARKALGLEGADAAWTASLGKEKPSFFRRLAEAAKAAKLRPPEGGIVALDTPWQRSYGGRLSQAASPYYRVETPLGETDALALLALAQSTDAFLEKLGFLEPRPPVPPKGAKPFGIVVVTTAEDYAVFVRWVAAGDAKKLKYLQNTSGCYADDDTYIDQSDDLAEAAGAVVHKTTEQRISRAWPGIEAYAWLHEGGAYLAVSSLVGSKGPRCISDEGSAVLWKDLSDPKKWEPEVRRMILRTEDEPLASILRMELNSHTPRTVLKSWSFLEWMLHASPAGLRHFLRALEKHSPEDACRMAFGAPPEALDRAWRIWALR